MKYAEQFFTSEYSFLTVVGISVMMKYCSVDFP